MNGGYFTLYSGFRREIMTFNLIKFLFQNRKKRKRATKMSNTLTEDEPGLGKNYFKIILLFCISFLEASEFSFMSSTSEKEGDLDLSFINMEWGERKKSTSLSRSLETSQITYMVSFMKPEDKPYEDSAIDSNATSLIIRSFMSIEGPGNPKTRVGSILHGSPVTRPTTAICPRSDDRNIAILSLSGRGIRGIIELNILERLEKETGKHTAELFDLVIGCSIGGKIAALLTLKDPKTGRALYDAKTLKALLLAEYAQAFEKKTRTLSGILGEKYKTTPLKQMIYKITGHTLLRDSVIPTLLTASNIHGKDSIKVFSSVNADGTTVQDAILATFASPDLFKSHKIGEEEYIESDINGNDTVAIGLDQAKRIFPSVRNFIVVSLGTGIFPDEGESRVSSRRKSCSAIVSPIIGYSCNGVDCFIERSLDKTLNIQKFRFNPIIRGKQVELDSVIPEDLKRLDDSVTALWEDKKNDIDHLKLMLVNLHD